MKILEQVLGKEIQVGGEEHSGWLPANTARPRSLPTELVIVNVRILEDAEGFILEYEAQNASFANDYWYSTIEDAKDAAKLMFGIVSSEWKVEDEQSSLYLGKVD
jgi:hypothetical protein